jgi:predicted nucleic acid-binding protein
LTGIEPAISVITRIELFANTKITEQEKLTLESFVYMSTVYETINRDIVGHAIFIRQQYRTKLPDAMIAATALTYDLTLVSRNISDFKNIVGLKVIDPYNL